MPMFFFHVRSGEQVLMDDEGVLADTPQDAVLHGYAAACDIAAKDGLGVNFLDTVIVEVIDEKNIVLARIPLRSVLSHEHPAQQIRCQTS